MNDFWLKMLALFLGMAAVFVLLDDAEAVEIRVIPPTIMTITTMGMDGKTHGSLLAVRKFSSNNECWQVRDDVLWAAVIFGKSVYVTCKPQG